MIETRALTNCRAKNETMKKKKTSSWVSTIMLLCTHNVFDVDTQSTDL
jgi:hypothetical protein